MALLARGHRRQVAAGAGVQGQRGLQRFALEDLGVGVLQVLEDAALERQGLLAKQGRVQRRQLIEHRVAARRTGRLGRLGGCRTALGPLGAGLPWRAAATFTAGVATTVTPTFRGTLGGSGLGGSALTPLGARAPTATAAATPRAALSGGFIRGLSGGAGLASGFLRGDGTGRNFGCSGLRQRRRGIGQRRYASGFGHGFSHGRTDFAKGQTRHHASTQACRASSSTSTQCLTGVAVPLCRWVMQPMLALTMTSGCSASRCPTLRSRSS